MNPETEEAMRLREVMTPNVKTIEADASAERAWEVMRDERIRHLVAMESSRPVGVISHHDLGGPNGESVRRGRSVRDLMSSDIVVANPDTLVRKAANQMRGRAIGCLPVMDEGRLLGIVTTSDLLDLLGRGLVPQKPRFKPVRRIDSPTRRAAR